MSHSIAPPPEVIALVCAALVQILAIALAGAVMNRDLGPKVNAGPRDQMPEGSVLLGRLRRAVNNGFEGLALFTPAVLAVTLTGAGSLVTTGAAWLYVAVRLVYIAAYARGWAPWRSLIWAVGLLATLTLYGAVLLCAIFG